MIKSSSNRNRAGVIPSLFFLKLIPLLTFFCFLIGPSVASAADCYLDAVNGSDSYDGLAPEWDGQHGPWKTLNKAQSSVSENDTVNLMEGEYGGFTNTSSSSSNWITYKKASQANSNPVFEYINLNASSQRNAYLRFENITVTPGYGYGASQVNVGISKTNYIELNNLEIIGDGYTPIDHQNKGIGINNSRYITIDGCKVWGGVDPDLYGANPQHETGFYTAIGANGGNAKDITVSNCEIMASIYGVVADGEDWIITNNHIHEIDGDGVVLQGETGGYHNSTNMLVANNTIHDLKVPLGLGYHNDGIQINYQYVDNVIIRNNIIYNSWHQGVFLNPSYCTSIVVENNLIYNTNLEGGWSMPFTLGGDLTGAIVRNNTVPGVNGFRVYATDAIITGNILYKFYFDPNPAHDLNYTYENYNIVKYWQDAVGYGNGPDTLILNSDQEFYDLFADGSNNNYTLKSQSQAVNSCVTEYAPAHDILGNIRDANPDAGCYEYGAGIQDNTAPSVPQNLQAAAVSETQIDLSWNASTDAESGISQYKIYRDGSSYDTSTVNTYSDINLAPGTNHSYQVSAVNGASLESGLSNAAVATTPSDDTPPTIESVTVNSPVNILFSEPLNETSAETIAHYSITPDINVNSATLQADNKTVILQTADHQEGIEYTLAVTGVEDEAGNATSNEQETYSYSDNLPDSWETTYFGDINIYGDDDNPDGDGFTNLQEYNNGTDPMVFDAAPSELVMDMKLDDTPSDGVWDSSSYANHGTCSGTGYPQLITGKVNNAYQFDGIDDYIQLGVEDLPVPWTAALWVKRQDSSNSNASLLESSSYSLKLEQYPNTNKVGFTKYGVGDYTFNYQAPTDGSWVHLAFAGTDTATLLYVNGVLVDTISTSISCPMNQVSSNTRPAKGAIDEIRIYNRALTAGEISDLYGESPSSGNNSPTAIAQTLTVNEDNTATVALRGSDPDAGDSIESYQITSLPSYGILRLNSTAIATNGIVTQAQIDSGAVTFAPQANWYGSTQLSFKASDGELWSANTALLTINVNAQNDAPTTEALSDQSVNAGETINLTVKADDIDNDTINLFDGGLPAGATFSISVNEAGHAEGVFLWTPTLAQADNSYTVTFFADDGQYQAVASVGITVTASNHALTLSAENGTISANPSQSSYAHNSTVVLTATPQTGYHFMGFSGSFTSAANPATVTMDSDKSIAANFALNSYSLNITSPNCSVTKTPDKASYNYGETVTLTVVAEDGYNFVGFSGDLISSNNPATITMDGDKNISATCQLNTYNLAVSANNGTITKTPDQASYPYNTQVTLTAMPQEGYHFVNFSGDLSSSTNPATVTMDSDKSIAANFALNSYSLNITSPNCSVTKTPDKASYNYGETVTLTVVAEDGYNFVGFSGDLTSSSNPATITMDSDKNIVTTCQLNTYNLAVSANNGTITKTPDQASYSYNTQVTLTATPEPGYHFVNFSGDLSSSTNPATVTMDSDKSVAANFALNSYSLNITSPDCSVTKTPDKASYTHGETVTLTVITEDGYNFVGFSGDLTSSSNPATITMDSDKTIVATCQMNTYNLAVSANNGTITKTPDQASYFHNTQVTLTATPDTGYHFLNFSGDLSSSANPATVTMDSNKSIAANFALNSYTLTVTTPNCTVIKTPDQALYNHGIEVTLEVIPDPGYNFVGFSGNASGSTNPITITMDSDKSITPNCQIGTYNLTTSGSNGTIQKDPDQASYTYDSTVTLTATPDEGYHFVNFAGDLTGSVNPGTITIDGNKNVSANFVINTYTLNLVSQNCNVTKTPDKAAYDHGETVTITAITNDEYNFVGWSGDLTGSVNPAVIIMDGDKSVIANCQDNSYSLTINSSNGTVTKSPDQASYTPNSTVTLTAVSQKGYHFVSFSGDFSSSTNPATVTIDTSKNITANFELNSYSLNVTASNCQVTASPEQSTYDHGQAVTLTVQPDNGYNFVGWSGNLTGSANPVTLTMDQNKTIAANCRANTYSLTTIAEHGSIIKSPDQASYSYNSTITLTAAPQDGYHFTSWSGDATGSANPFTITLDAAKTVIANFDQDTLENHAPVLSPIGNRQVSESSTLSFEITATDQDEGDIISYSVTTLPQGATFTSAGLFTWQPTYEQTGIYEITFTVSDGTAQDDETILLTVHDINRPPVFVEINDMTVQTNTPVTFIVQASDPDDDPLTYSVESLPQDAVFGVQTHTFTWTPQDTTAADYSITFIVSDGEFTDYQTIIISVAVPVTIDDVSPPTITQSAPKSDAIQAPVNGLIILDIADTGDGIDPASLVMKVQNNIVYQGDLDKCVTEQGLCRRIGTGSNYTLTFQSADMYNYDEVIEVTIDAKDKADNIMPTHNYSFTTEMLSFTTQQTVNTQNQLAQCNPATILDSNGNIWAAYETGTTPERSISVSKMAAGESTFQEIAIFANTATDVCAPVLDVDGQGKVYLAWQDNRRGTWDIYVAVTANGLTWSSPVRVTDSQADQQQPVLAIDNNSPANVYIAWIDNRAGNNDIYSAASRDGFATKTITAVTNNTADQTAPCLAASADNKIYAVWSDARNTTMDIYGASLNNSSWIVSAIVQNSGDQSYPALAAGDNGSELYLTWQDNTLGNNDIFYAALPEGLPGAVLTGRNIVDDNIAADQSCPAIAVTQKDGEVKVFVSWQDQRNVNNNNDSDIYLAEVLSGAGTNVLVTDDSEGAPQSAPVISVAADGQPYLLWVDSQNTASGIYYNRTATIDGQIVAAQEITASDGGIVGTPPDEINDVSDISVQVPAGAFWSDVDLSITRVDNPPSASSSLQDVASYEFGPSSEREFALPVTITLPYAVADASADRAVYWYNPQTGALSQSGISNIEDIVISSTLRAMRFRTTHFSQYITGTEPPPDPEDPVDSGTGGCSLSRYSHSTTPGNIIGYFLPYLVLLMLILALKRRDFHARNYLPR